MSNFNGPFPVCPYVGREIPVVELGATIVEKKGEVTKEGPQEVQITFDLEETHFRTDLDEQTRNRHPMGMCAGGLRQEKPESIGAAHIVLSNHHSAEFLDQFRLGSKMVVRLVTEEGHGVLISRGAYEKDEASQRGAAIGYQKGYEKALDDIASVLPTGEWKKIRRKLDKQPQKKMSPETILKADEGHPDVRRRS